jgi:arginase
MNKVFSACWRGGQKKNGPDIGSTLLCKMFFPEYSVIKKTSTNGYYHKNVYEQLSIYKNTLLIGGDHSVAIGSVLSSVNKNNNVGCLWIDAHPDIHTPNSSISGNVHGMPVSYILGHSHYPWSKNIKHLSSNNLHYWGIRDIDQYEKDIINLFHIDTITHINQLKNIIAKNYDCIHVSIDIDGLDPKYTPSTGTLAPNGLSIDDVVGAITYLKLYHKNINFDIVEFNPLIGSQKDVDTTLFNISKIIEAIM